MSSVRDLEGRVGQNDLQQSNTTGPSLILSKEFKELLDKNKTLSMSNTFYAGLLFGLLISATLFVIFWLAKRLAC